MEDVICLKEEIESVFRCFEIVRITHSLKISSFENISENIRDLHGEIISGLFQ